jgi:hypothetical protein
VTTTALSYKLEATNSWTLCYVLAQYMTNPTFPPFYFFPSSKFPTEQFLGKMLI